MNNETYKPTLDICFGTGYKDLAIMLYVQAFDGLTLEREFETKDEALTMFLELARLENMDTQDLRDRGFTSA